MKNRMVFFLVFISVFYAATVNKTELRSSCISIYIIFEKNRFVIYCRSISNILLLNNQKAKLTWIILARLNSFIIAYFAKRGTLPCHLPHHTSPIKGHEFFRYLTIYLSTLYVLFLN